MAGVNHIKLCRQQGKVPSSHSQESFLNRCPTVSRRAGPFGGNSWSWVWNQRKTSVPFAFFCLKIFLSSRAVRSLRSIHSRLRLCRAAVPPLSESSAIISILSMNPHLTLALSPPIGWERRGNRRRTRVLPRRPVEQRPVHGSHARQEFGVAANHNPNVNRAFPFSI